MKIFLICVAMCTVVSARVPVDRDLSSGTITNCDEDDPQLNDCIRKSLQEFWSSLKNGNKKLFIPPLDPYKLADLKRDFNILGLVHGNLELKGVKVYGMSSATIHDIKLGITEEGSSLDVEMTVPRLHVEGKYKSEVIFDQLTLNPRGYFNVTLTDVKVKSSMSGKFTTIKGVTHLLLDKFDAEQDTGDAKIYATGLLQDPYLNGIALTLANRYWPIAMRIGIPETKDQWAPVIIDVLNQFLIQVPFNRLLNRKNE